jgi:hypothetical protein
VSDRSASGEDLPQAFRWSEEEKALLRRTLRVRSWETDRIVIDTLDPRQIRSLSMTLTFVVPALAIAAAAVSFGTVVAPQGLVVPTWMLAAGALVGFLLLLGGPRGPVTPGEPITLFAGTPWCVRHRQAQSRLEILKRTDVDTSMMDRRSVPLATDVGPLLLHAAHRTPTAERLKVRQLVLDRCTPVTPSPEPPAHVVNVVGSEVAQLPRAFCVPLHRYLDVVSVTSETLTVCGWPARSFATSLVLLTELLLLLILPLLLPGLGAWPSSITVGPPELAWAWRFVLFGLLVSLGPIHIAIDNWQARRGRSTSLTFSKQATFLTVRDGRSELQIPTNACLLSLENIPEGENLVATAFVLRHGKKLLARWDLSPDPSMDEQRALERGLHEYLRSGNRSAPRPQEEEEL